MDVRDRIENGLERWGHFVCRHAWVTIALVLAVVASLASQLPRIHIDPSMEVFLHEDDPIRTTYDRFRVDFGRDDQILVAFRADDVFDLAFLERLREFHEAVEEEVPRVNEVSSLINARSTRGLEDELRVEDLFEEWPETPEALAEIKARARANPIYRNLLLSADGRLATVLIKLDAFTSDGDVDALAGFEEEEDAAAPELRKATGLDDMEAVAALERLIERFETDGSQIYMAGAPAMNGRMQMLMRRDMGRFTGLAVLSIAGFLGFLFRRVGAVVLPLLLVGMSVVCTLATMAITDTPIAGPTQILPSFLLAVGIGGSVHVLAIFFQHRRLGESTEDSVAFTLGHSGLAIAMTGFTTAGGLSSFAAAELAPISHFGTFGPLGVLIALVLTLVLLPALLAVFPMKPIAEKKPRRPLSQRVLARTGDWCTAHPAPVLTFTAVLVAVSVVGASRIYFSFSPMDWFPEADPFRISNEVLDTEMDGAIFLEALFDTGRENGLHEPEMLRRIQGIHDYTETVKVRDMYVGKSISLVDVVKEIHQALNENRPELYAIPGERTLVAQELLLFENSGSDDLEDFVDPTFQVGRFTMKAPFVDAAEFGDFIDTLEAGFVEILGEEVNVTMTGIMSVMGRTIRAAIETMLRSYILAFIVITPLMILLIGRLGMGLLSMIPNLTPIILTLGLMGWVGIPLNPFTLLIGSIALGLAVDDTIHFMHNFRRYFGRSRDVQLAVRETLLSTGQAMLFTTLVLATGFFIFMFASLGNLFHFGLLTGFTVLVAFLADMIVAPALMALVYGREATLAAAQADASTGGV